MPLNNHRRVHPPICAAINRAVRNSGRPKGDIARALGVDPSTLTHWLNEREPALSVIRELEAELRLPPGQLYVDAGIVKIPARAEEMIARDSRLAPISRRIAVEHYQMLLSMSSEGTGDMPAPMEPKDRSRVLTSMSS